MRTVIDYTPFTDVDAGAWNDRGAWPCSWIGCPGAEQAPFVAAFKLELELDAAETIRVHVSADERYELFLDGGRLGRGPERGDPRRWHFETYDLALGAGRHVLAARVWALGDLAPVAQFSLTPGFLLCPEDEKRQDLLGTGRASWAAKRLPGYSFVSPMAAFAVGHRVALDAGEFPWGFERGEGGGWLPARKLHPGYSGEIRNEVLPREHLLYPAVLPPMLDEYKRIGRIRHIAAPVLSETHAVPFLAAEHLAEEAPAWDALLAGAAPLTLPPQTKRRVLIDLGDYYCAYPEVLVSGGEGGTVRLHWQESLFADRDKWDKGRRDEIEGKYFTTMWWDLDGIGDLFRLDGGQSRRLEPLWWSAGRYVELLVETSNQALTIDRLGFRETRYPLTLESSFQADDPRLAQVTPLAFRALQVCAHETYMDCPYFEQLMYVGDARLEALVTYVTGRDDRLPRKALRLFDSSRLPGGLTQSRYPSRLRQIIPPFSLWWIGMVHDYLMWRGDPAFVRTLLPGVRAVLDAFTLWRGEDGLVRSPCGWNYMDWVPSWPKGEPPGAQPGEVCPLLNWQYVYALCLAAQIEEEFEEPEMAARDRRLARETAAVLDRRFWSSRGLYADDSGHSVFTEHSQCLAVLGDLAGGGLIPEEHRRAVARNLFAAKDLTPPTVYFMHYFFETCRALGRMDVFLERMSLWFEMVEYGFKTTYENGDPHTNRSDCHAWGAHPLYHYFASVLGIRPAGPGFRTVEIAPQLASLRRASGRMVHPAGEIVVELQERGGALHGAIELPPGVSGTFRHGGREWSLREGRQEIHYPSWQPAAPVVPQNTLPGMVGPASAMPYTESDGSG